ncbi:hypothetical protein C8Q74DRAFT_1367083 [Fomes fomentarius]|nr:hypothetical protein C8Q74DRAFT_1367083 [Fomes fomentarius]
MATRVRLPGSAVKRSYSFPQSLVQTRPSSVSFPDSSTQEEYQLHVASPRKRVESLPARPVITREILVVPPLEDIPEIPDEDESPVAQISRPPRPPPSPVSSPRTAVRVAELKIKAPDVSKVRPPRLRGGCDGRRRTRKLVSSGCMGIRPSSLSPRTLAPIPEHAELITLIKRVAQIARPTTPPPLPKVRASNPRLPRSLRHDAENKPPSEVATNDFASKVRRVRAVSRQFGRGSLNLNK